MEIKAPPIKVKLPHNVIVKAPGLLPMMYTLREITEHLELPMSTLRNWFKAGVPYEQDSRNQIWINGQEFARWVEETRPKSTGKKLSEGEAYCIHCKSIVKLLDSQVIPSKGKLYYIKGSCPACGHKIVRGGRNDH